MSDLAGLGDAIKTHLPGEELDEVDELLISVWGSRLLVERERDGALFVIEDEREGIYRYTEERGRGVLVLFRNGEEVVRMDAAPSFVELN